MKKRVLSLLLTLVMMFSLLPVNVLAAEVDAVSEEPEEGVAAGLLPDGGTDDVDLPEGSVPGPKEEDTGDPEAVSETTDKTTDPVDSAPENVEEDTAAVQAPEEPFYFEAEDLDPSVIDSGTCGENLTWTLDAAGTLTIAGTGPMTEFSKSGSPWNGYKYSILSVVIQNGVTTIGSFAFYEFYNVSDITIPENVTRLGEGAVYMPLRKIRFLHTAGSALYLDAHAICGDCYEGITNVLVPDTSAIHPALLGYDWTGNGWTITFAENSVASGITDDGFVWERSKQGAVTITGIAGIPDTDLTIPAVIEGYPVTEIGELAFYFKTMLTGVVIPEGVTTIGPSAFSNCWKLVHAELPESLISLGRAAFRDCRSLVSITFPKSLSEIPESAFSGCCSLTEIVVPEGVLSVGPEAFFNDYSLTDVRLPNSLIDIEEDAFVYCTSLTDIALPAGLRSIGESAFEGCSALKSVTIPASVTELPFSAFRDAGLTRVVLTEGLRSIGEDAFRGTELINVTIPASVNGIGEKAFEGCTDLTRILFLHRAGKELTIEYGAFSVDSNVTTTVMVTDAVNVNPAISAYDWAGSNRTITYEAIPTSGVTAEGLLWELNDLGSATITGHTDAMPAELEIPAVIEEYPVTAIGAEAFLGSGLKSISIPESVTSIGKMAFQSCLNLTGVTIPGSVATIGEYAFHNCTHLKAVTIPKSVAVIRSGTFKLCGSLTGVTIPAGVTAVESYAFMDCTGLKSVTIPGSVTAIGDYAFFWCENLTSLTIPEGVTSIGGWAFQGCSRLKSVTIPASVTAIGENAFNICGALRTISFAHTSETALVIGERAFHQDDLGATTVLVPDPENLHPAISTYDWVGSNRAVTYRAIANGTDDGNPETPDAIALDREYLILKPGESVVLTVTGVDEAWLPYVTWHWEPAEENIDTLILTVDNGKVTAMTEGTAYVIASLTAGGTTYTARCRVDVVDGEGETPIYDEVSLNGVRLPVTKATVELFKTDYTKIRIEPMLSRNMAAESNVIPQGEQDLSGVGAIESARFLNEAAAALFDLRPADDGSLEIIPKDSALAKGESAPKSIKGSYKSQIAVTIEGKELTAQGTLTLTVKKSLPGIKAKAVKLNSFIPGDSREVVFTGGTVTGAELNPAKTQPGWLAFDEETGAAAYTGAADAKKSGKLYLLVTAEGWAIKKAVTVSVSAAKSAPKISFKPESLSLLPVGENYAQTAVTVSPAFYADAETFPVRVSRVTEVVNKTEAAAEDALAYTFDGGTLTVRPAAGLDTAKAHTFKVYLNISGPAELGMPETETAITVKTPVATGPKITVKAYGAIDLAVKDSRTVLKVTAKEMPADTISVSVAEIANSKTGAAATDRFLVEVDGTDITLKAADGLAKGTYNVSVLTDFGSIEPVLKNVLITVKESAAGKVQPSLSLKASGSIDVLKPGTKVTLTPTVKNCYTQTLAPGDLTVTRTYDSVRKAYVTEDVTGWFDITLENGKYVVAPKDSVALCHADKFNVKAEVQTGDGPLYSGAVTLKVTQSKVKVKQSVKSVTLLKFDRYSEGEVRLTVADPALTGIAYVELDTKSAAKFDLKDLGNGVYAIGYAGDKITTAKGATVKLRVFMAGNLTTKPNATISVKVVIK